MEDIEKLRHERNTILKVMDSKMLDPGSEEYHRLANEFERVDNSLKEWEKIQAANNNQKAEIDLKYEDNRIKVMEIETSERNSKRESRTNLMTTIIGSVTKLVCTAGAIFATLAACGLDETKVASKTCLSIADKFTKSVL